MMDCAAFENRLTEVLAAELDPTVERAALEDLRRHAGSCADCSEALDWVELAALPPAERDPLGRPPAGYWDGFNASVARRIEAAPVGSKGTTMRRLAVAAAIVLALSAGWVLRGRFAPGLAGAQDEQWRSLAEVIGEATPEELAAALRNLPNNGLGGFEATDWSLGDAGVSGAWVPDADELDETDQRQLTEWLDQLDQAEGRPTS